MCGSRFVDQGFCPLTWSEDGSFEVAAENASGGDSVAFIVTLTETLSEGGTFEVAVTHHTGCGSSFLADPEFRHTLAARIHADKDSLADQAVTDPTAAVRIDVDKLTSSSLLPARWSVSGHIYDLDTGLVTTITDHR
jgi:carbonic anhydrase